MPAAIHAETEPLSNSDAEHNNQASRAMPIMKVANKMTGSSFFGDSDSIERKAAVRFLFL